MAARAGERGAERSTVASMVADGYMTEEQAREVEVILELVAHKLARGEIAEHFLDLIAQKLGRETALEFLRRMRVG